MMHAKHYRSIIFTRLLIALLVSIGLFAAMSYVLNHSFNMNVVDSLVLAGGTILVLFIGVTWQLIHDALLPLAHIAYSLEHLDAQSSPSTKVKPLKGSAKVLTDSLLKDIYGLASNTHSIQEETSTGLDFLQALIERSPVATLIFDRHDALKFYNQAARQVIPNTIEEPKGQAMADVLQLTFQDDKSLTSWLADCRKEKIREDVVFAQVKAQSVEGETYFYDLIASYSKQETHGMELIIQLVNRSDFYKEHMNEASFVSLAVHELRTPITLLRGYIEVFEDEVGVNLNDEMKDFMHKMSVSASQLSMFVNNILNVARIENNSMKTELQETDWANLLSDTSEQFQLRANVKNRVLKLEIDGNLPMAAVDQTSIIEVLSNLVDNAIKYSHEGGEIIIHARDVGDGFIETTVQDFGIGIPTSIIDHLFEKFYRSHRSKESVGGTGLGLFLSKSIIEAHGGSIWVRSTEGKGSVFGFTIPTYASAGDRANSTDDDIQRSAHGWIKNHGAVRK